MTEKQCLCKGIKGFIYLQREDRAKKVEVRITSVGILNICNLWILLRKIVIYLVGRKCHLHDVIAGISLYENLFTDSRYDITAI